MRTLLHNKKAILYMKFFLNTHFLVQYAGLWQPTVRFQPRLSSSVCSNHSKAGNKKKIGGSKGKQAFSGPSFLQ